MAFWKKLLKVMKHSGCTKSRADPFLCFKWTATCIVVCLSWIDDYIYCGKPEDVVESKEEEMKQLCCEEYGELNECVGCKIEKMRYSKVDPDSSCAKLKR